MKRVWKLFMAVSLLALTMLLVSACGGGGGGGGASTTLKGTAAAGAPIIGTVYVKDSKGAEKSVPVEATDNGKYSIDVSDMTGPFKLKAVGMVGNSSVTYCSLATADDLGKNINITPFTDLIVASIASQVATNFYTNGDPAQITTAAIATQVEALTNALTPVLQGMGISTSIDLLRASFTPNVDAVDKMMDIVKVSVDPATTAVTIENIIDKSKITSTAAGGTMTGTLTAPTTAQLTDIELIRDGIKAFTDKFASTMPLSPYTELKALFDETNFMDNGRNLDNFLQEITTDGSVIGMTASAPTFIEFDSATGKALVEFTVTLPKNANSTEVIRWRFQKTNGVWYALGDGRILEIEIGATAYKMQAKTQQNPSVYGTGIALYIEDEHNTSGVHHVTVTGPGLPGAGVALYQQISNTSSNSRQFTIDPTGMDMNNVYWLANDTAANDSTILAAFPAGSDSNIPYTVKLYNSGNTQMDQYTIMMTKRPYTYAELATAPFATLVKPATLADLTGYQLNVAQTITWTLAAGTTSDWLHVQVWGANGEYSDKSVDLTDAQTSATATLSGSFTPMGGSVWLTVEDADKRMLSTSINGN